MITMTTTPKCELGHCIRFKLGQKCISLAFKPSHTHSVDDQLPQQRFTPYQPQPIRMFDDAEQISEFSDPSGDDRALIVTLRNMLTELLGDDTR